MVATRSSVPIKCISCALRQRIALPHRRRGEVAAVTVSQCDRTGSVRENADLKPLGRRDQELNKLGARTVALSVSSTSHHR